MRSAPPFTAAISRNRKTITAVTEQVIVSGKIFPSVIKEGTGSTITEEEIRKLYTKDSSRAGIRGATIRSDQNHMRFRSLTLLFSFIIPVSPSVAVR